MELMRLGSKLAERTILEIWVFMVKWQLNVTPRFLTESYKGTDAQPTVIKSGKEKERDLELEGRTITNLSFADDIDGLAGQEEELAKLVERLDKVSTVS